MSLYTTAVTIIQTLKDYKTVFISLFVGATLKLLLNVSLMNSFNKMGLPPFYGNISATIIGYLVSLIICLYVLHKRYKINYEVTVKEIFNITCATVIMGLVLFLLRFVIPEVSSNRLVNLPIIVAYTLVGAIIYFIVIYKSKTLHTIFGENNLKKITNKLFKKRNTIFDEILNECKNYLENNNNEIEIKNIESKILVLNNKKDKLLELVMEEYLSKEDYKKQIDLINEDLNTYHNKINELKNNKKDKNYIENKINEIKNALEKCLEDNECYSDIFNELIDKIIVHKQNDKQIKLDVFIKTGESINTLSDSLGKKFHLLDSYTTSNSGIRCCQWGKTISTIHIKKYLRKRNG